jgi:predicted nuclease of predicted toxin-antitoxin system
MKFLIDAQLPRRLAIAIRAVGHDVIHTFDLPDRNATPDSQINNPSIEDERIVVTKDADFVSSFYLTQRPYKLLLISTGNITNAELENLFLPQLPAIVEAFEESLFLELSRTALIIHV